MAIDDPPAKWGEAGMPQQRRLLVHLIMSQPEYQLG
jgi:hypothetical protein